MEKAKFAVVGGTGFESLFQEAERMSMKTPYGTVSSIAIGNVGNRRVVFLPRHGSKHSVPPHKINYRANVYALHKIGVERIIAINAVGAINRGFKPCDILIPHDFIDFTKFRNTTFYESTPVTHIDVSRPYCPEMRKLLIENTRKFELTVHDKAVLVCTEGPRFETPAEIEMFRRVGCDVVGMTGVPEAVLARELEMCYAALCFVSNMAAGVQEMLTPFEVSNVSERIMPKLEQALTETIKTMPLHRKNNCPCSNALKNARIKK